MTVCNIFCCKPTEILKAIKLDKLFIDNTLINKEIYVGFCENILKGDVKALISNDIIGDE